MSQTYDLQEIFKCFQPNLQAEEHEKLALLQQRADAAAFRVQKPLLHWHEFKHAYIDAHSTCSSKLLLSTTVSGALGIGICLMNPFFAGVLIPVTIGFMLTGAAVCSIREAKQLPLSELLQEYERYIKEAEKSPSTL